MLGYYFIFISWLVCSLADEDFPENDDDRRMPTIFVCILARNKAHTLPYFFGQLENLDYPKDRMRLWIRSDHSSDNTTALISQWVGHVTSLYHDIDFEYNDESASYSTELGPFHWPPDRMNHLIALRQEALDTARLMWADYILYIDCDQFLTNPKTLRQLIAQRKTIIAPMLRSLSQYSNFWAGVSAHGYYERTDSYEPYYTRNITGCFNVPVVHSTFLIDLRRQRAELLAFDPRLLPSYTGPQDDILLLAYSARLVGIDMFILNTEVYGILLEPLSNEFTLDYDIDNMVSLQLDATRYGLPGLLTTPFIPVHYPVSDRLGFDHIYLINLQRRPERRKRMETCLRLLGINATHFPAVDGKQLSETDLKSLGIVALPEYQDPYHHRPLTFGEIGCFMSHYRIWEDVIEKGYHKVIVFEDDLHFVPYFRRYLLDLFEEISEAKLNWDLVYLGRKRLNSDLEGPLVDGFAHLSHVPYSYWTLAYALTKEGARKLLAAEPLGKLLPVDEFLPIMFDKHPESSWAAHFPTRDLKAFTAEPLLIFPTHYTGEPHHFSDTEDAGILHQVTQTGKDTETIVQHAYVPMTKNAKDEL